MRYAIYFTPPASDPLTLAAQAWLGRNAFSGGRLPALAVGDLSADEVSALTAEPRRYGFHGTLVAPFRLGEGASEDALLDAADAFCAGRNSFDLPPLQVAPIGPFFALRPSRRSAEIEELADEAVDHFAPFRAPLSQAELARRNPERLSPRQRDYLERYGYPFVREEFCFHLTLTGPVREAASEAVLSALRTHFGSVLGRPHRIDAVSVFVETKPGAPLTVLSSHRLGSAQAAGLLRHA